MRRVTLAAVAAGLLVALAGCTASQTHAPSPSVVKAQQDARRAVAAVVDLPAVPVTLAVAGATAAVDAVKTDFSGALLPPQDVSRLGWWADSALPGSGSGTVVIAGHVDDQKQGDGFAKRFRALKAGDRFSIATKDQRTIVYQVDSVMSVRKQGGLPVDRLNKQDGPETLALITCGGEFVGPPLGYVNNDVVWAHPIG